MRVCVTNAGVALISRRIAQTERVKTREDLIMDGHLTPFKVAGNNSCISVNRNRYFLIDGSYWLGGRVELNLLTDMYTRCKMKSEKHVVYSSLFSSKLVSAFLASSIEGITHSQSLALLEHVSSIKNNEVTSMSHKNFWSEVEKKEEKKAWEGE